MTGLLCSPSFSESFIPPGLSFLLPLHATSIYNTENNDRAAPTIAQTHPLAETVINTSTAQKNTHTQ